MSINKDEAVASIRAWAVQQTNDLPVITVQRRNEQDNTYHTVTTNNTITRELRRVLSDHLVEQWRQLSKPDLINELLNYVTHGVVTPLNTRSDDGLLDDIWHTIIYPISDTDITISQLLANKTIFEPTTTHRHRTMAMGIMGPHD